MKTFTFFFSQPIVLMGAFLAANPVLAAPAFENNMEKTFQVTPGGKLVLQADQGSCKVTSVQSDKVQIRVLQQVPRGTKAEADELFANHEVTFLQDGSTVSVLANAKRKRAFSSRTSQAYLEVRYEITIPKRFDVDLKTSGGDIRVGDLEGKAKLRTASGVIDLQRATGDVNAFNSGGNITIAEVAGELVAQTSSGFIRVRKVKGRAEISNSGGDIQVDDAEKTVVAKTSSGRIRLRSVNGDVKASNSGGDITADLVEGDITATTSSGSIYLAQIKGKTVNAKNSGGSIEVGAAAGGIVARTSSGAIKIKSIKGLADLKNSGGDIEINEVGGLARAETSSGTIKIKLAKAKVEARNSGGNIEIQRCDGAVLANTSSGLIAVGLTAQPTEGCRLEVAGGDIKLTIPGSLAMNLDAKSNGGTVQTELPVTRVVAGERKPGALQGKINGGGPTLFLRASSGNIQIKASR